MHTEVCYPPLMTAYMCVTEGGGFPLWSKENLILYFPVESSSKLMVTLLIDITMLSGLYAYCGL